MEKKKRGPGRPPFRRKSDRKDHCFTVRIDDKQYRKVKYLRSIKPRFDLNDYIRDAIDVAYETYSTKGKKKDDAAL